MTNIPGLTNSQKTYFQSGDTLDLSFRLEMLGKLRKLLTENYDQLCDAIYRDFGKPEFESYGAEIATLLQEIDHHTENLKKWSAAKSVKGSMLIFPSRNKIYYQPYGSVLIIGTWNYPVYLLLLPLVGAISAGNCIVLKPSELAPETSGTITRLIDKYFDSRYLAVVEGGVETGEELLKQKFDYIFFTGSSRVGKIVMKAAAEHLTPVTLELGGKSPAIVHKDADPKIAARRIWWGKYLNAGQTCVAPDFVAVHKSVEDPFIHHSKKVLDEFFNKKDPDQQSYTKIVNNDHYQRLVDLLSTADPIIGGETDSDSRHIYLTLVKVDWDHTLMQDEIFGPILPIIVYDDFDNLTRRLYDMPSPLALYLFTDSDHIKESVIRSIPFGGGCINDTISHFGTSSLPVGGIGPSGMGNYHGKHSFDTFSHQKSILEKPLWPDLTFRYPPYSERSLSLIKKYFS